MCTKDIVAALAIGSLLAVAQQPACLANLAQANLVFALNLSHQNAVGHLQHLAQLQLAIVGRTVNATLAPAPRGVRPLLPARTGTVPTVCS